MAMPGTCRPGRWNQSPTSGIDSLDLPPAALVQRALALPKAPSGMAELIRALLSAMEAKSPHTASHLVRVGRYARLLAAALALPEAQVAHIARCGLLHDVGKLGIPEEILEKPGKLTDEEWGLIQLHPIIGASLLRRCPSMQILLPAIAMHHERWDGRGYPYGAKGRQIPLEGRIIAVCDTYDTMTSRRPYKPPMPAWQASERLAAAAGTQLDPDLVSLFIDRVIPCLAGGVVRLEKEA